MLRSVELLLINRRNNLIAKLKKNVVLILIISIVTSLLIATALLNSAGSNTNRQGIDKVSSMAQEETAIVSIPNPAIFLLISAGLIGLLGISRSKNNLNKKNRE